MDNETVKKAWFQHLVQIRVNRIIRLSNLQSAATNVLSGSRQSKLKSLKSSLIPWNGALEWPRLMNLLLKASRTSKSASGFVSSWRVSMHSYSKESQRTSRMFQSFNLWCLCTIHWIKSREILPPRSSKSSSKRETKSCRARYMHETQS